LRVSAEKLTVLIVGCGNIAGGFDIRQSSKDYSLTHAEAFNRHPNFELKACCDTNPDQIDKFLTNWNFSESFQSIEELENKKTYFDVISVCNPTEEHSKTLEVVLKLKPKLVFCEKPLTHDVKDTKEIISQYKRAGIPLAVNYSRRWMEEIEEFKINLQKKKWGELRSVVAHYNKGILNNGSHIIDLMNFLFETISLSWVGKPLYDYFKEDPTIPAVLSTPDGKNIFLNTTNSKDFSLFEIQFFMERGVVSLEDSGMLWRVREVKESEEFEGYKVLTGVSETMTDYSYAMDKAIQNIYDAIVSKKELKSCDINALLAQEICNKILSRSLKEN